jgi:hypothetical protein
MGCWNKTCAISQFPIAGGDATVNFILVEESWTRRESRPCYSSDAGWKFIPIPFYGEYNTYGWQDDDAGQQHKYDFLAKYYKHDLIEVESEKERAKMCYPDCKNPFKDNESLGDSIHGNVWNLRNPLGGREDTIESRTMGTFMVSRIVWDTLTANAFQTYPKKATYSRAALAECVQAYLDYQKEQNEEAEYVKTLDPATLTDDQQSILFRQRMLHWDGGASDYAEKTFGKTSYDDPRRGVIRFTGERQMGSERTEIPLCDVVAAGVVTADDIAAMYLFVSAIYSLRKSFAPQVGEGSQSGIDHNHKLLVKAMNAMIKHDKTRWED